MGAAASSSSLDDPHAAVLLLLLLLLLLVVVLLQSVQQHQRLPTLPLVGLAAHGLSRCKNLSLSWRRVHGNS
jgi:hypothetical protein